MGAPGHYIFSPAHAVAGDVPPANMMAFILAAQSQSGAVDAPAHPRSVPWFRPADEDDIIGV
jgi:hypothetical protein